MISLLGEDARYLSDGEEIGSQQLFEMLNKKNVYTGEDDEGDSELKYLELIRQIRDEQPALFERIRKLPKKARSGHRTALSEGEQLVTFFRLGKLKKFYQNRQGNAQEITFFDAVKLLECAPETLRAAIPAAYYHLLETNKERFHLDTTQEAEIGKSLGGGRSNLNYIEGRLKDKNFRQYPKFTDDDLEFLDGVRQMLAQGLLAKKVAQTIKKEIETTLDPLAVLGVLRRRIRTVETAEGARRNSKVKREVILSGYLRAE